VSKWGCIKCKQQTSPTHGNDILLLVLNVCLIVHDEQFVRVKTEVSAPNLVPAIDEAHEDLFSLFLFL